jgi:Cu-Zn family superoxide dismutase
MIMLIPTTPPVAIARISGGREVPGLTGTAQFYPMWDGVLVVTQVRGLPREGTGIFALHIHEGSRCSGADFTDTGGHFNPTELPHPGHAGDLPPLFRCCGGRAYMAVVTNRFTIPEILGRTVVIHSGADDFRSQPAGNAGRKIACGLIRRL